MGRRIRTIVLAALALAPAALLAALMLPLAGLQNDEAIFAQPLYAPQYSFYAWKIGKKTVPVMLLTYLGDLKAWVYTPLFRIWRPGLASIRIPVLLMALAAVYLFWRLLNEGPGRRAAIIGARGLAGESGFVMTSMFDWGPVALQHLLFVAALLLLARFAMRDRPGLLARAAFCAGLALWDKALFLWAGGGMAVALAAVYPKELGRRLSWRNAGLAVGAFLLGAAPLIVYNATHHWATFRSNARFTTAEFRIKFQALRLTASGSGLFGYIVSEEDAGSPKAAATVWERGSEALHRSLGEHRRNGMDWAYLAAGLSLPFLWFTRARKPALCCALGAALGWLQMAVTQDAGGSVHHAILLWPLPDAVLAMALAEGSARLGRFGKPALAGAVAILCGLCLLNLNQNYYQLWKYGAAGSWSDAMGPLANAAGRWRTGRVYASDWGIAIPLLVLSRGRIPVELGMDALESDEAPAVERGYEMHKIADGDSIWVGHAEGRELFPGYRARLERMAAAAGYRKDLQAMIRDTNGRPVFEVFRFVPEPVR